MIEYITRSEAECLKEIYNASIEDNARVSSITLARVLGIKPPSVIDVLKKLAKKGLVERKPWSYIKITEKGLKVAREIMHHHRVLEQFYTKLLKLDPDTACKEASKVDYLIGCNVVTSIYHLIGTPERCFHGNPLYRGYCGEKDEE
jgi:DtxR family Mn-dependent transcriptional regulator